MITRKQLIDYLVKEKGSLPAASPIIAMGQFPLVTIYDVIVDVKDYGTGEQEETMLSDVLESILSGGVSEADKNEIINEVLNRLPIAEEVSV